MSAEGVIFDVREFCLQDGDGIRTTVFFKGCPLRCALCHNPEGLEPAVQTLTNGRVCGRKVTAEALAAEIHRQDSFLLNYGGGVTFSGGEPMMQPDFLVELAERLRPLNLAIETSGYAAPGVYERVVGSVDFVIQDIKQADPAAFKKWCGGDLAVILRNLAWLKQSGKPFLVRIPVIPTANDSLEVMAAIAALLKDAPGLRHVELKPFNSLAGAKYPLVNKVFPLHVEADMGFIKQAQAVFKKAGIKIGE